MLHIPDDNEPNIGLTAPRMDDDILAFIWLPHQMSLDIIGEFNLDKILSSLSACKNLWKTALSRGNALRVFTDYGKHVSCACVGPQPSRNSNTVRSHLPFTQALPECHWQSLVWLMKCVKDSFRILGNHRIISLLVCAKKLVLFKTFTSGIKTIIQSSMLSSSVALGLEPMFFYVAILMLISPWVLFRCSSRVNANIP